jgi:hypothetical protein
VRSPGWRIENNEEYRGATHASRLFHQFDLWLQGHLSIDLMWFRIEFLGRFAGKEKQNNENSRIPHPGHR